MKKGPDNIKENLFLIIAGPTGTGKSSIAAELCRILPGEIINADSRQFYKDINIGTAKPPEPLIKQIPHHLYSFITLKENFTVFDYRQYLEKIIPDIWSRKKQQSLLVEVVFISGQYLKEFLNFLKKKNPFRKISEKCLLIKIQKIFIGN